MPLEVLDDHHPEGHVDRPEGHRRTGVFAAESAAQEAWEEAGVRGRIAAEPFCTFNYEKWGGTCTVKVFVLRVEDSSPTWLEQGFRRREWVTIEEAIGRVHPPGLAACLRQLPDLLVAGT